MKKYLALFILLTAIAAHAQPSPYSNALFNPVTMTATGQTSAPLKMAQFSAAGGGFNLGTVTVKATALTTVTFGILGSADNGATYFPLNIWSVLTPGTVATTATATTAGLYQFSLAGITNIEYVTSGTFTATGLSLILTATPAPSVSKNTGGTGGAVNSFNGRTGSVVPATGDYTAAQVTNAASTAAANTFAATQTLRGDATGTPGTWTYITSTATGATTGLPTGYGCSIQHTFVSGSNYAASAWCATSSGAIGVYLSAAHALGSESFTQVGSITTAGWSSTTSYSANTYKTASNCSSAASPAVCAAAAAGSFVIAAGATTVTVNTTALTANSQIIVQADSSLGTKLGVTCNTTLASVIDPIVTARTAATSFAVSLPGTGPVTNPGCYSFTILN